MNKGIITPGHSMQPTITNQHQRISQALEHMLNTNLINRPTKTFSNSPPNHCENKVRERKDRLNPLDTLSKLSSTKNSSS